MTHSTGYGKASPRLFDAGVVDNIPLCREHFRLVLHGPDLRGAAPGQFLHLGPISHGEAADGSPGDARIGAADVPVPMLRRAFSVAGMRRRDDGCHLDVIYRVVGTATTWMASLRSGDSVSVIGPLGNVFPINTVKRHAWVVGGGVGLPPMLWLAEALRDARRRAVAVVGARSADLLALTIDEGASLSPDATSPMPAAAEFNAVGVPVVISTDDGSLGYRGYAAAALSAYFSAANVSPADVVVYTCGPEALMESVARFCMRRSIECYVCMERSMACGMGTCQSCVVAVGDESAVDGWRYALCCTEGPVFDAARVIWSGHAGGGVQH